MLRPLFVAILALQALTFAENPCSGTDCTNNTTVDNVQVGADGGITACFATSLTGGTTCNVKPACASMEASAPGAKAALAAILSAQTQGSKVDVYVKDACLWGGWKQMSVVVVEKP